MTIVTRFVGAGCLTLGVLSFPHLVAAHQLAVPGNSPANPVAVLSVPDAGEVWEKLGETPIRGALMKYFADASASGNPLVVAIQEQGRTAGEELGFSLHPDELFTRTLRGFDLYSVTSGGAPALVGVFAFNNEQAPRRILDQLKREVRQAGGTSGGFRADAMEESVVAGRTILDLPAFALHLSAQGNVLVVANDRNALDSSAADQGRVTFNSDFFKRYDDGLGDAPGDIWFFGEPQALMPLALRGLLNPGVFAPDPEIQKNAIARLSIHQDSLLTTTFMPTVDMEITQQRLARAAPVPSDLPFVAALPESGVFHFASNYFDGLAAVDGLIESLTSVPGSQVQKSQIQEQMTASTTLLGFDLQNDLFANLGPEAVLLITSVGSDPNAPIWSQMEGAILVGVRDEILMEEVLEIFEESATAPATATREAVSFINEAETPHGEYRYFEVSLLAQMGLVPSYQLTPGGKLLVTTNRELMERMLEVRAGEAASIMADANYQSILDALKDNRNSIYHVKLPTVFRHFVGTPLLGATQEGGDQHKSLLELLSVLKSYTVSLQYHSEGRLMEYLIRL